MSKLNAGKASVLALVATLGVVSFLFVKSLGPVLADSGSPTGSITATYNTVTGVLSASGTYNNAPGSLAGYALFIDGATPVTPGTGSLDTTVHTSSTVPSGPWSDSHTLATAPTSVCVVIYDVHSGTTSGNHSNVAAGATRNTDNSYETNNNSYDFMVIDGKIDINKDGTANNSDDGTLFGKNIIDGQVDWNTSGNINNTDDSPANAFNGFTVIDGKVDINNSGTVNNSDDGVLASDSGTCTSPTIITPTPTPDPCIEEENCPTPTPVAIPDPDVCHNIDGVQTSVPDGMHLDPTGLNCLNWSQSGPPVRNDEGTGSQVLGASTTRGQVLGASTMAGTGSFDESLYQAIMSIGATLSAFGLKGLKKSKKVSKK